jgi:phosphoglycolate phosphatase-like HAD superfamily hydrolase
MNGNARRPLRGVLFDIDGVLIDSKVAIRTAIIDTFRAFGYDPPTDESVDALYWATDRMIFEELLPQGIPHRVGLVERMVAFELDLYENKLSRDLVTVGESVISTLKELKRRGLRLGVVTNNLRRTAMKILSDFGLLDLFACVVAADDVSETKPSPKPLIEACLRLGVNASDAAYVGDSYSDAVAGRMAGLVTILLTRQREFDGEIAPDYWITDLKDLLRLPISAQQ